MKNSGCPFRTWRRRSLSDMKRTVSFSPRVAECFNAYFAQERDGNYFPYLLQFPNRCGFLVIPRFKKEFYCFHFILLNESPHSSMFGSRTHAWVYMSSDDLFLFSFTMRRVFLNWKSGERRGRRITVQSPTQRDGKLIIFET